MRIAVGFPARSSSVSVGPDATGCAGCRTLSHVVGLIQRGQEPFAVLYGFFLSSVCARMNLQPGMEFRVAHEVCPGSLARRIVGVIS
jgi:hypothetical protein